MSTTITDNSDKVDEGIAVPVNLLKPAFGITGDFWDVEFDHRTNAIILYGNKARS